MLNLLQTTGLLVLAASSVLAAPAVPSDSSPPTYPDVAYIDNIFSGYAAGKYEEFFTHVAPNVHWVAEGTSPLAGTFNNATTFYTETLEVLGKVADPKRPLKTTLVNIIGGAPCDWSVQELHIVGYMKNGLYFDNQYSYNTRWSPMPNSKIVQAQAYLDSWLVTEALNQNYHPHLPMHNYYDIRN